MKNTMHKTIGDQMKENRLEKRRNAQKRIDEIEEILLEMPFTDPEFQQLSQERNNLLILVTT